MAREAQVAIRLVGDLKEVASEAWDACAGPKNPFVSHAFLSTLEASGSVGGKTGWLPRHLVLEDEAGLLGAVPLYLKGHSYGEYVFDHGWANAYEQAGGRYYPKLQASVPFTPASGPRLLVRPGADRPRVMRLLAASLERVADELGVSSVHITFPTEEEWDVLGAAGWLQRTGIQYHWSNRGYADFEAFLADLSSRKRKAIRKERRTVAEAGVKLEVLTGEQLTAEVWRDFDRFYRSTSDRKWGWPYLTPEFFTTVGRLMGDRIALVIALHEGRRVAGALNFIGADTLYGRNWGADGHWDMLHFEACYYQAIEFAIARGLKTVEAGAQGEHKIQRGYLPVRTMSAHLIRDPALAKPVAQFLQRERTAVDREIAELAEYSPFRHTGE